MSPVVPFVSAEHLTDQLAVSLPRYAKIVDYSEAAFFGVRQTLPQGQREYTCRNIWSRYQRQAIARELMAAQGEFWQRCGYPFVPTWIAGERHDFTHTFLLNNCRTIALGVKVDDMIVSGLAVSHATDPVVITLSTTVTDLTELHVFHPGTDYEIDPSGITISGGTATIEIPRVRMVALANDDNPEDGWDYTDTSLFEQTVDIRHIYNDPTHQVQVFGLNGTGWANYWNNAHLRSPSIGHVKLTYQCFPAVTNICGFDPSYLQVSYLCGLTNITPHMEDAIIRLAHSRMPSEPCGCDFLHTMWEHDKHVPDVLDTERLNCPWGTSDGAWMAYQFADDLVCYRGRAL